LNPKYQFLVLNKIVSLLQVMAYESKILEPMSIVMIISMELGIIGQLLTVVWRIYYDKQFSVILIKLEDTYEQLKSMKLIRPLTNGTIYLHFVGFIIYFALHMVRPLDNILHVKNLSFLNRVNIKNLFIYI